MEYNDSFNPYFVGKITGATLNKDGKLVLEISSRGFSMKSKFKDCMPKGQLKGMRIQIDSVTEPPFGGDTKWDCPNGCEYSNHHNHHNK